MIRLRFGWRSDRLGYEEDDDRRPTSGTRPSATEREKKSAAIPLAWPAPLVSGRREGEARVCRGSGWLRPLVCWAEMLSWAPAVLAVGPGFQVSILFLFFYFPFSLFTCLQTFPNKISKANQNNINLLHNRKYMQQHECNTKLVFKTLISH
jgi:hypothetical protein